MWQKWMTSDKKEISVENTTQFKVKQDNFKFWAFSLKNHKTQTFCATYSIQKLHERRQLQGDKQTAI